LNEFGIMLITSVAFTFIFAGFTKLISIKDSSRFARKLGLFPPRVGAILGFCMPLMELTVGIGIIISNNSLIYVGALAVIMFFIIINFKSILDKKGLSCFCYGNLIKTKLGPGGFIHYIYLLFAVLLGFFISESNLSNVLNGYAAVNLILICGISFLIFINGLIIRMVLDKLSS